MFQPVNFVHRLYPGKRRWITKQFQSQLVAQFSDAADMVLYGISGITRFVNVNYLVNLKYNGHSTIGIFVLISSTHLSIDIPDSQISGETS